MHNGDLTDLYSSANIIRVIKSRRMIWAENVACMGEEKGAYSVFVEKPEGEKPIGRPGRRWANIKMALQEVGCGGMDWIVLAQNRGM